MLFTKTPQIYTLIDEWAEWKYDIHPYKAGAYRSLMIRFAKSLKLKDVEEISEDHIAYFAGGELTGFYSHTAFKAIKSFLWYAENAGYECVSHNLVSKVRTELEREDRRPVNVSERKWSPGFIAKWRQS